MKRNKNVEGTVYLIHFNTPYKTCRHYIGWSSDPIQRENTHANGNGNPLLKAVKDSGNDFKIVRYWDKKTRAFERSLKKQKHSYRFCPVCNPNSRSKYLKDSAIV